MDNGKTSSSSGVFDKMAGTEKTMIIKRRVRVDVCKYEERKFKKIQKPKAIKQIYELKFDSQLDFIKLCLRQMSDVMLFWYKGVAKTTFNGIVQPGNQIKASENIFLEYPCDETDSVRKVNNAFESMDAVEEELRTNYSNWVEKTRQNKRNLDGLLKDLNDSLNGSNTELNH